MTSAKTGVSIGRSLNFLISCLRQLIAPSSSFMLFLRPSMSASVLIGTSIACSKVAAGEKFLATGRSLRYDKYDSKFRIV